MEVDAPVNSGQQRPAPALNPKIYTLFEAEPEVREALFFDEGHPDAEGFELFAATVADAWIAEVQP